MYEAALNKKQRRLWIDSSTVCDEHKARQNAIFEAVKNEFAIIKFQQSRTWMTIMWDVRVTKGEEK